MDVILYAAITISALVTVIIVDIYFHVKMKYFAEIFQKCENCKYKEQEEKQEDILQKLINEDKIKTLDELLYNRSIAMLIRQKMSLTEVNEKFQQKLEEEKNGNNR